MTLPDGRLSLTRRVTFAARHRYHRAEWDEARNAAAFGAGPLRELHRHEYACEVTVSGPVDAATGMLVDLRVLDEALRTEVLVLDGRTLNTDVAEFADGRDVPTCENLARFIAGRVQRALGGRARVSRVTVAEDPTLSATWSAST